jgi:hypothetical protein
VKPDAIGRLAPVADAVPNPLDPQTELVRAARQVWNLAFPQGQFAQSEGERLHLADDLFPDSHPCWSSYFRCPEFRYCPSPLYSLFSERIQCRRVGCGPQADALILKPEPEILYLNPKSFI